VLCAADRLLPSADAGRRRHARARHGERPLLTRTLGAPKLGKRR
jgi:hypothetical protein